MEPEVVGNRVKKLMKNRKITLEQLAKNMNIDEGRLKNKLDGKEEFYIGEMSKIKEIFKLNVKECDDLFFNENVKTSF